MIEINKIYKEGDLDPFTYSAFPVIDFKFQNIGNATAILWEFYINIKSIKLDLTPNLLFRYDVVDNNLEIFARNDGYGKISNCAIKINNNILNKHFSDDSRASINNISSDEEVLVCALNHRNMTQGTIRKERLDYISITWNGEDESGNIISNEYLMYEEEDSKLYLAPSGFIIHSDLVSYMMMFRSDVYCVLIDVDQNPSKRIYSISRKIASGDVDRFHIMVGATKSSIIHLNFNFKVDSDIIVTSKEFSLEIWNPIDSSYHSLYIDGETLSAELGSLDNHQEDNHNRNYHISWEKKRKWKLLTKLKNDKDYPFLNNDLMEKGRPFPDDWE